MIAGQADLVAVASDGNVTVYDVKTGAQRDSDVAQVMIYMYALPLAADSNWKGTSPDGRVVYCIRTGPRSTFPQLLLTTTSGKDFTT